MIINKKGKITLNGNRFDEWLERTDYEDTYGPNFSFWAKNNRGQILRENDFVVVTVQMEQVDKWLLVSISRVTKIYFDKVL